MVNMPKKKLSRENRLSSDGSFDLSVKPNGNKLLPNEWRSIQVITTGGYNKIYLETPDKQRLKSKKGLADYIKKNNLPLLVEDFSWEKQAWTVDEIAGSEKYPSPSSTQNSPKSPSSTQSSPPKSSINLPPAYFSPSIGRGYF